MDAGITMIVNVTGVVEGRDLTNSTWMVLDNFTASLIEMYSKIPSELHNSRFLSTEEKVSRGLSRHLLTTLHGRRTLKRVLIQGPVSVLGKASNKQQNSWITGQRVRPGKASPAGGTQSARTMNALWVSS